MPTKGKGGKPSEAKNTAHNAGIIKINLPAVYPSVKVVLKLTKWIPSFVEIES
jgi:hypothetical protein